MVITLLTSVVDATLVLSGAGFADADGEYTVRGEANGRHYYANTKNNSCTLAMYASGSGLPGTFTVGEAFSKRLSGWALLCGAEPRSNPSVQPLCFGVPFAVSKILSCQQQPHALSASSSISSTPLASASKTRKICCSA